MGSNRSRARGTSSCSGSTTSRTPTRELVAAATDVDAIVCLLTDRIDRAVLEAGAGRLRVVANVAVGYDNIDVAAATELGIAVCNTPGVLDETTADLAFLLILAASRLAHEAEADLRAGRWNGLGDHRSTSAATCTARRSASSASGASGKPSPAGRPGSG